MEARKINKPIITNCEKCNKPFRTNTTTHTLCRECFCKELDRKNTIVSMETCKDCGNAFAITVGMQEFYASHELPLPKRCEHCRAERRKAKEA